MYNSLPRPNITRNSQIQNLPHQLNISKNPSTCFPNEEYYKISDAITKNTLNASPVINQNIIKMLPKRVSTNLTLQTHKSIISLYEKDLKFTIKKEQEYLQKLQKEYVSLSNEEDFKLIKSILLKPPQNRSKKEILFIKKAFCSFDYFRDLQENLDDNSFDDCIINLKCESQAKNIVLFKNGDFGKKTYLILKGEVSIYLHNELDSNEINSALFHSCSPSPRNSDMTRKSIINSPINNTYFNKDYTFIRSYKEGEVFGDNMINNNRGERTVLAICKEKCVFATISSKLLQSYFEKKSLEKIELLRKISLFKNISVSYLQPLLLHCQELHFKKDNFIYKTGDPASDFYFVSEGEIELSKKTYEPKNLRLKETSKYMDSIPNVLNFMKQKEIIESGSLLLSSKDETSECLISIISKGEYFGEKELINGKMRDNLARCKSRVAILYAFPNDKLLEKMKKLASMTTISKMFIGKSLWESHSFQRNLNIAVKKTPKNNILFMKRRKSKSCDAFFDLKDLLSFTNFKPNPDSAIRNHELNQENVTKAFLESIQKNHSKIKQLTLESQLDSRNVTPTNATRLKKEDNLMVLFSPSTAIRTDYLIKKDTISKRTNNSTKKRVHTFSNFHLNENKTYSEDASNDLDSAILYKTLKCDKFLPKEMKIQKYSKILLEIKKNIKTYEKNRSTHSSNIKKSGETMRKENSTNNTKNNGFLFNFVGNN